MKRTSKSTKLPCAFCQGKGTQPGAGSLSCIVCRGSGQVRARQPYKLCKECGGRGRKKGANLYCLLCHGRGFVEENRYSSIVESSVPRRKKREYVKQSKREVKSKRLVALPPKADLPRAEKIIKTKVEVKKERKSFFKKFFSAVKIL